jgi:dihydroorotate dehydrogenase (NAD+) catalytic subunit
VDAFIEHELPELRKHDLCVIANIRAIRRKEYATMGKLLSDAGVDLIEVNISCPNVKAGGLAFGTCPSSAAEVTAAVKCASRVPVMVKLSPNVHGHYADCPRSGGRRSGRSALINTLLACGLT